jgi:hypothetical protein
MAQQLAVILPLALFALLAAMVATVLRRAGRIVARIRELESFRGAVRDLAARIELSLGGAADQVDAVRRHQAGPESITDTLAAATDAVERYLEEVRALRGPAVAIAIRDDMAEELARAARAIEMVGHGCDILRAVRRGDRELEAQTSIKRGYLNLLHARAAIARHAARAAELDSRAPAGGRVTAA